ncbi:hypothetical protein MYXO_01463 [Myxococcaceae bacterium]|jgi:hypothetical protein|nr:hypothetical protein MYXO_01463 [Myxococcaceae bacterium]
MQTQTSADTLLRVPALSAILVSLALSAALACATKPARPPAAPASTERPALRCRKVLEVRPATLGSAATTATVEQCEPVAAPAPASEIEPSEAEPPLGASQVP